MGISRKERSKQLSVFLYPDDWEKFKVICDQLGLNGSLAISDFVTHIAQNPTLADSILSQYQTTRKNKQKIFIE